MRSEDWINASTCTPEDGHEVLVYDDAFGVLVAEHQQGYGWSNYEHGFLERVTHWMWLILPD